MPPRLLSFLSAIEHALVANGYPGVDERPERFVSYQKAIARMTFRDGSGSITLQNFTLADGQICVKAEFHWTKARTFGTRSVFPTAENFDWKQAANKISEAWVAGLIPVETGVFQAESLSVAS